MPNGDETSMKDYYAKAEIGEESYTIKHIKILLFKCPKDGKLI